MLIRQLFDRESSTYTYLLADRGEAALIDPVREQVGRDLDLVTQLGLKLVRVLETHVHADHVTAAGLLRERTGARTCASVAGAPCVDLHLQHGTKVQVGDVELAVLATPGHTDDSLSYYVPGAIFTGDALLIRGCGRTDFQNGDAGQLYDSITQTLFALPDDTVIYPAHDYRGFTTSTIGEEKRYNARLSGNSRDKFVEIMGSLGLPPPAKLNEAVPANRSCGFAPSPQQDDAAAAVLEITPAAALDARGTARLVDVRELDELTDELGRVPGSEHVPLATLSETSRTWDKHQPVIVICRSGGRSRRAAETLVRGGFERVLDMTGGLLAYRAAGLPTER
jgi:glyoxylase-like metal-dependent hydrolase (beta-lactamase superfamily II)/rhodanese-related sulfurtransferase